MVLKPKAFIGYRFFKIQKDILSFQAPQENVLKTVPTQYSVRAKHIFSFLKGDPTSRMDYAFITILMKPGYLRAFCPNAL